MIQEAKAQHYDAQWEAENLTWEFVWTPGGAINVNYYMRNNYRGKYIAEQIRERFTGPIAAHTRSIIGSLPKRKYVICEPPLICDEGLLCIDKQVISVEKF